MKKALIISYFFSPCNLTAAQRIMGWAKYLKEYGYEPVVITRNWDNHINQPEDVLLSSGSEVIHEKNDNYEVYYLPYKASRRDRIYTKHEGSPLQKLSRIYTFYNLIAENFSVKSIPHYNMYSFARTYLQENKDIDTVIISGNPFNQFHFGYLLEKEFNVKWIADYRDDWNTTELEAQKTRLNSIIGKLQTKSEKKWVKSASMITSVSSYYVEKISDFVKRPGHVVLNGFELGNAQKNRTSDDSFVITYNGSLYASQPIEPLLEVIGQLIRDGYNEIKLRFPGLAFDPQQASRVEKATKEYSNHVSITNRIPKEEVIKIQQESDLLVMIAHSGIKGVPSSKLYEYLGLRKEILLYPNDHNIIEETLLDTELGIICDNKNEIYKKLKTKIDLKRKGEQPIEFGNFEKIKSYSRQEQTKELARLIDKL